MAIINLPALTKDNVKARARLLLKPLDLEGLITKGILVKKGAWYRILQFKGMPEHAWVKVSEIGQDKHGTMIKFKKLSKRARTQLEKVIGTPPRS